MIVPTAEQFRIAARVAEYHAVTAHRQADYLRDYNAPPEQIAAAFRQGAACYRYAADAVEQAAKLDKRDSREEAETYSEAAEFMDVQAHYNNRRSERRSAQAKPTI